MIHCNLKDSERIESLHPLLKELFDYVKSHDFTDVPYGRIELEGKDLFINYSEVKGMKKEDQVLEYHQQYMDVHIPLSAPEIFGWKATRDLNHLCKEYDAEKDFALSDDKPTSFVEIAIGEFVIVYPEDAHAPNISPLNFSKLVAKVKL